jgi:hypothetical protein
MRLQLVLEALRQILEPHRPARLVIIRQGEPNLRPAVDGQGFVPHPTGAAMQVLRLGDQRVLDELLGEAIGDGVADLRRLDVLAIAPGQEPGQRVAHPLARKQVMQALPCRRVAGATALAARNSKMNGGDQVRS